MELHEKRISETKDPDKLKMLLEDVDKVNILSIKNLNLYLPLNLLIYYFKINLWLCMCTVLG